MFVADKEELSELIGYWDILDQRLLGTGTFGPGTFRTNGHLGLVEI